MIDSTSNADGSAAAPKSDGAGARLRHALFELEAWILGDELPNSETRSEPTELGRLLRLLFLRALRAGPVAASAAPGPDRVLRYAARCAELGLVAIAQLPALRDVAARAERRIRESGAWKRQEPLWWQPLPELAPLEKSWRTLVSGSATDALRLDGAGAREWRSVRAFVPPALARRAARELEQACQRSGLELYAGKVGAATQVSGLRTDSILWRNGLEPDLLEVAPTAAALLQWLLGTWIVDLVGDRSDLVGPEAAMLARYPPSAPGYRAHYDNPGGAEDNGRAHTFVVHLGGGSALPEQTNGGGLKLYEVGADGEFRAVHELAPEAGQAVLFDSRRVPHEVLACGPLAPRWALVFWLVEPAPETTTNTRETEPWRDPTAAELLVAVDHPPLAQGRVLFRDHSEPGPTPRLVVTSSAAAPRAAIVATVAGASARVEAWLRYHLDLGFDHLVVVFDQPESPALQATRAKLRAQHPSERLTMWTTDECRSCHWSGLDRSLLEQLRPLTSGDSCRSIAARQTLHASAALLAAQERRLDGPPIDWLLHLDLDELFHLQGPSLGGSDVCEHFASAQKLGWEVVRYLNHELLLPQSTDGCATFKAHPRWAACRLGVAGFAGLERLLRRRRGNRDYFHGYQNGKAAVRVATGHHAAGVHGWATRSNRREGRTPLVAGPSVLHLRFPTSEDYAAKRVAWTATSGFEGVATELFEMLAMERKTADLLGPPLDFENTEQGEEGTLRLYRELTHFEADEIELLEAAGLLLRPQLPWTRLRPLLTTQRQATVGFVTPGPIGEQ